MGLIIFLIILYLSVMSKAKEINGRTCTPLTNPNTFKVYELECTYEGGVYTFEGSSVRMLTMDRLTQGSHLRVLTPVAEIKITMGSLEVCNYMSAP